MSIFREHRADWAVDHSRVEYRSFTRATLTLHESIATDFSIRIIFLLELDGEWEEISIFRIPDSCSCEEEVPIFIGYDDRSCREEGETTGFEGDIFVTYCIGFRDEFALESEFIFESDEHKEELLGVSY